MKIKIFYPDPNGKISFTKEELEDLLKEAYDEGFSAGKESVITIPAPLNPIYPNYPNYPQITYTDRGPVIDNTQTVWCTAKGETNAPTGPTGQN